MSVLLLCVTASSTATYQQFYPQKTMQCQSVQELLNCSLNLEKYVKTDFYDFETFDNCTRILRHHKYYYRQGEKLLLKECTQSEAILFLAELLHEYRYNFPLYGHVNDLLKLARSVSAKIRYRLRYIAVSGVVLKMVVLHSVVRDVSVPMTVAIDVVQFLMEMEGFEREAKMIGAVGTTVLAAAAGFSLANVPGSAIGAGIGFLTWVAMETKKDATITEWGKLLKK